MANRSLRQEVAESYQQISERLGRLPSVREVSEAVPCSQATAYRHLQILQLPTRGKNGELAVESLVAENQRLQDTLDRVNAWLADRDEQAGVNLGGEYAGEWSSAIDGRLELVGILEGRHAD